MLARPMKPILEDAFAHNVWATLRLLDVCLELTPEQLATNVPGTYGSILDTMRHLVGADVSYLATISGERFPRIEEEGMELAELRAAMERAGSGWKEILGEELDPERIVVRRREDGEFRAPLGVRLAQALHHGTDHRSQICTALTTLGIEPPEIDVWSFARAHDRVVETSPTS